MLSREVSLPGERGWVTKLTSLGCFDVDPRFIPQNYHLFAPSQICHMLAILPLDYYDSTPTYCEREVDAQTKQDAPCENCRLWPCQSQRKVLFLTRPVHYPGTQVSYMLPTLSKDCRSRKMFTQKAKRTCVRNQANAY